MNNLPLQPLVWDSQNYTQSAFHQYLVRKDGEAGKNSKSQYEVAYGRINTQQSFDVATGFATIDEAKTWAWNHYNEKMRPYVKPAPTWISVEDRLPSELKTVLITYEADLNFKPRKFMTFALREGGDWLGIDDIFGGYVFDDEYNADKFNDDLHGFNITHWMSIPEFSTMQNNKGE